MHSAPARIALPKQENRQTKGNMEETTICPRDAETSGGVTPERSFGCSPILPRSRLRLSGAA